MAERALVAVLLNRAQCPSLGHLVCLVARMADPAGRTDLRVSHVHRRGGRWHDGPVPAAAGGGLVSAAEHCPSYPDRDGHAGHRPCLRGAWSVCIFAYIFHASSNVQADEWSAARLRAELGDRARQLELMSTTDSLAGIQNRLYFDHRLVAEWSRAARAANSLSMLIVDVDHFKRVNDTHGHAAGDRCLVAVAQALRAALHRPSDRRAGALRWRAIRGTAADDGPGRRGPGGRLPEVRRRRD